MTDPAAKGAAGSGEVLIACKPLSPTLDFFTRRLGFRIETIFPADDPQVAVISGHGLRLRLHPDGGDPGSIRLPATATETKTLIAPNGARIDFIDPDPPIAVPPPAPAFIVTRAGDGPRPGQGRAGMTYRDLIPGRLGGYAIASHITLPKGGPVADWVHFHKIRFQLIFCRRGWARLVYEDQGEPFLFAAGDCVLQPPRIRHRVLENSDGFEVVEIGCPALHETLADHDLSLPTGRTLPERDFDGQRFVHRVAAEALWRPVDGGFERQDTGLKAASGGLVDVAVLRPAGAARFDAPAHDDELLFGFALEGSATLKHDGDHPLGPADAFVIPPGKAWGLREVSENFRLLDVRASRVG